MSLEGWRETRLAPFPSANIRTRLGVLVKPRQRELRASGTVPATACRDGANRQNRGAESGIVCRCYVKDVGSRTDGNNY